MVTQLPMQYVDVLIFYTQYSVFTYINIILKCIFWVYLKVKNQGRPGPTRPTRWTLLWLEIQLLVEELQLS
jgi:hypothetical protein